jgi:hypothetical protein
MREAIMKCHVVHFIPGTWPEKLFCDELILIKLPTMRNGMHLLERTKSLLCTSYHDRTF